MNQIHKINIKKLNLLNYFKGVFFIFFLIKKIFNLIGNKIFIFNLLKKKEVISGPFKGMKYSTLTSVSGALVPRLIGNYESEIITTIYELKNKKYEKIINIGAAEGYYAIGFSYLFPHTIIDAYEIDNSAIPILEEMIKHNNKEHNIFIRNYDCYEDFKLIMKNQRFLVFSDCEGYEFKLFDDEIISNMQSSDLIIEMHTNSFEVTELENKFSYSHSIHRIFANNISIELDDFKNFDVDLDFLCNISKVNRSKFHYFLILKSKLYDQFVN